MDGLRARWEGYGIERLHRAASGLSGAKSDKLYFRTLNDVGRNSRTIAKAKLAKQVGVTQKVIAADGNLRTQQAHTGRYRFQISTTGRELPLNRFKPKQIGSSARTKRAKKRGRRIPRGGVTAAAWGKRKFYRGAFIGQGSGNDHVFKRVGPKSRTRDGRLRQPLEKLWGPSIPKEMLKDATAEYWQSSANNNLQKAIERNIRSIMLGK